MFVRYNGRIARRLLLSVSFLALALPSAHAQEVKLEEITVTARKQEENLMTVPLAISALSATAIEARDVKSPLDLADYTPGFYEPETTAASTGRTDRSNSSLVFRGLNVAGNSGLTSAGSLFVDGAPVSSLMAEGMSEVSRVEVLRGPQSVYFGRATFAGAINFITRDPNLESFQGRASAEVSSYGSTDDSLEAEGPLVQDKLGLRLSAHYLVRGGDYTNAANPNDKLGRQSTASISGTLFATPSDALKIKAYFNYYRDDDGEPAQAAINTDQLNCTTSTGPYICGKLPQVSAQNISAYDVVSPFISSQLIHNANNYPTVFDPTYLNHFGLKRDAYQSDIIMSYQTEGGYSLNSITAYHYQKYEALDDLDFRDAENVPNPLAAFIPNTQPFWDYTSLVQQVNHDWSQELRVTSPQQSRFRWVAGANYLDNYSLGNGYLTAQFGSLSFGANQPNYVHTTGVFGGAYYDLATALTLSVEARYQWDQVIALYGTTTRLENTFRALTPRVTLDYKLDKESTLYALWSRGERPGGFNAALLALSPAQYSQAQAAYGVGLTYQQEKLDNFEVGFKDRFLDDRASVRIAAYYGVLTEQQVPSQVFVTTGAITQGPYAANINLGKTDIYGLEFEGDWQASNHLLLSGTFDWAGSNIRRYDCLDV